jgi:hypothetical protein
MELACAVVAAALASGPDAPSFEVTLLGSPAAGFVAAAMRTEGAPIDLDHWHFWTRLDGTLFLSGDDLSVRPMLARAPTGGGAFDAGAQEIPAPGALLLFAAMAGRRRRR